MEAVQRRQYAKYNACSGNDSYAYGNHEDYSEAGNNSVAAVNGHLGVNDLQKTVLTQGKDPQMAVMTSGTPWHRPRQPWKLVQ